MNPLNILIADDEAIIRMDIKELLEEKGVLDEETFPLETKEDAMLIVIASMYGQAPKRCYDIQILNDVIDRKDQRYKNFLITKRGGKK